MKNSNKVSIVIKGASFLLIAASIILATTASAKDKKDKMKKNQVLMCHVTDAGSYEIIVDGNDVNFHLSMGDYMGPCIGDDFFDGDGIAF